ncbi:hypothetical protein Tco_0275126, partial [Tanacetum coccineum]
MIHLRLDELIHTKMVETIVEVEYCCMKTDEMVSSADLQQMQVDLDYAHAEDELHLHRVRV